MLQITNRRPHSNPSGAMLPRLVVDDYFHIDRDAYVDGRKPRRGGPFTVPPGSYFMLGDNRDDSIDSRAGFKSEWWFVPAGNLIGPANYIYWSGFERFGRIGLTVK